MKNGILVLDFGSQYTQLIARRLRELGIYSELLNYATPIKELKAREPKGIILSGGPSSVTDKDAPLRDDLEDMMEIAPVLGICYGMQLISKNFGGIVESATKREYGRMKIKWSRKLGATDMEQEVWMSHGDVVKVPPPGFEIVATSSHNHPAAMISDRAWAFQFHPEVAHTKKGTELLDSFVFEKCKAKKNWQQNKIAEHLIEEIKHQVPGNEKVLCALSGGVDSSVVAVLLSQALGADRVRCVFVDTGLLRKNEYEDVLKLYEGLGLNVTGVNAEKTFLKRLDGVIDPEKKRKIIGHTFIDVFKDAIKKIGKVDYLAQGTLYPDVIESVSPRGTSVTIKTHHNVGGLPKDLNLKLIEPLRELFKDEVRAIGKSLGMPKEILGRHPFPGPGLAIRLMGAVNKEDLDTLREVDSIYVQELKKHDLYDQIWQAFCVLTPIQTVGVQGDNRTYDKVVALRAVTSSDGMTADWFAFNPDFMRSLSNRITNEVKGINRVVYDVTSKPPGTIEWE